MILRLSHVVIAVDDLAAAREFYVDLLGFIELGEEGGTLYLRGAEEFDTWSLGIVERGSAGLVHSAFRVSDPGDLEKLERLHERLGTQAWRIPAGAEPGQGEALRVLTPDGHSIQFVHEIDEISAYDADGKLRFPMRNMAGRVVGVPPARLDHVNLRVPNVPQSLPYWMEELDFSASEYWMNEDETPKIAWLRRSMTTHDIALGTSATGESAFHHFAFAVAEPAGLQRAADLLGDARIPLQLEWGPARHGATNAFAMYIRDPAGNRLELYSGDYLRDHDREPLRWRVKDYELQGHSWWAYPPPPSFAETNPLFVEGPPSAVKSG
jgi:catechol 2,3-dioxygenase